MPFVRIVSLGLDIPTIIPSQVIILVGLAIILSGLRLAQIALILLIKPSSGVLLRNTV